MVKVLFALTISSAAVAGLSSDFKAEWVGHYCGIKKAERSVIRDENTWRALWKRMGISAPVIDFKREMALAVFMGERRTGGYSIRILGYSIRKKRIIVKYQETAPPRGAMVTLALTQPHHIVLIEKSPALKDGTVSGPLPVRFKKVP